MLQTWYMGRPQPETFSGLRIVFKRFGMCVFVCKNELKKEPELPSMHTVKLIFHGKSHYLVMCWIVSPHCITDKRKSNHNEHKNMLHIIDPRKQ